MKIQSIGFYTLSMITLFFNIALLQGKFAVTAVPVADLLGQPITSLVSNKSAASSYQKLPLSAQRTELACPRLHQLLFNEVVTVIKEQGDELLIETPHLFYELRGSNQQYRRFWTLKDNIVTFDELKKHSCNTANLPVPLGITNFDTAEKNTVILIQPHTDKKNNITYSVGTRFVLTSEQTDVNNYQVFALDRSTFSFKRLLLPKEKCIQWQNQTKQQRIKNFLKTVKTWANAHPFIPYVWGGCSLITTYVNNNFQECFTSKEHKLYYVRSDDIEKIKTGLDCAGLILRAAQLVGIPYFYKNTTTIANQLKQLTKNETLTEGDIIWIPGHVMIVSNIKKGLLIEARGYKHGYGKIQEISLSQEFDGIKTYDQLIDAFFSQKSLKRKNKQGEFIQTIPTVKLLKLSSVWRT